MKPEQIRLARDLLKLTQAEFAQVLDVHQRTVSRWERGKLKPRQLQLEIIDGLLYRDATEESDSRVVGRTIRSKLNSGHLLQAHAALVVYTYKYE